MGRKVNTPMERDHKRYREITRKLRKVERSVALKLRNENAINDAVLRKVGG